MAQGKQQMNVTHRLQGIYTCSEHVRGDGLYLQSGDVTNISARGKNQGIRA